MVAMGKKSNEPFVFGDVVRTLDGRGPIMLVTDAAPANQLPCMILCQYWSGRGLCEMAVHAGLLESCEPITSRPKREPLATFFELMGPVVTVLVEAVDLMAAVQSGRSRVVSVDDEPEASGAPDIKSPVDGLADCRTLWCEIFGGKTPLTVFDERPSEEKEAALALALSLSRSASRDCRQVVVAELELLMDFALRCGYQLDRRRSVECLNRLLDTRIAAGELPRPEYGTRIGNVNNGHT